MFENNLKTFVFLEKLQIIIKMAINKVSKTQHECTEIQ